MDMSVDILPDQELESLRLHLKQGQDKVFKWTVDELNKNITVHKTRHDSLVRKALEQKEELVSVLSEKQKENVQTSKALQEKCCQLEKLKQDLEEQCRASQEFHKNLAKNEETNERLKTVVQQKKQAVEAPTKARQKLEYLDKASNIFGNMLGLTFKKIKGNNMQVIFTHIDEKDPLMMFYFFLQVEPATRKYVVSNPAPQIQGVDELVSELNRTNNLRRFMLQMRQLFKDTLKTD